MGARHIPSSVFQDEFWEVFDHLRIIDNYTLSGDYLLVVDALAELWERKKTPQDKQLSDGEKFAQLVTELAMTGCESLKDLLAITDYTPCWLVFQIMSQLLPVLQEVVTQGLYKHKPIETDADLLIFGNDSDTNAYGLEFPQWLIDGITKNTDKELTPEERLQEIFCLHSGDKLDSVTFMECVSCYVLKPDIQITPRLRSTERQEILP